MFNNLGDQYLILVADQALVLPRQLAWALWSLGAWQTVGSVSVVPGPHTLALGHRWGTLGWGEERWPGKGQPGTSSAVRHSWSGGILRALGRDQLGRGQQLKQLALSAPRKVKTGWPSLCQDLEKL